MHVQVYIKTIYWDNTNRVGYERKLKIVFHIVNDRQAARKTDPINVFTANTHSIWTFSK